LTASAFASLAGVRPFTLAILILLFLLIVIAAVVQVATR